MILTFAMPASEKAVGEETRIHSALALSVGYRAEKFTRLRRYRRARRRMQIGEVLIGERGVALQTRPVEVRTGIGLAARRDVRVAGERFDRVVRRERLHERRERRVLRRFERRCVAAFELDADRKVVAALASEEAGR